MSTVVYTDGACSPNPGPGGWAWAVPDGPFATGVEAESTNQRMEVTAALEAVRALPGELLVVSDSQYVVKCHTDRWYVKWEKSGWNNSNRKPVANADLWKPLVELFHSRGDELRFQWVRGHSDDVMNDIVDRLAVEAARTQIARNGTEPPTALGAPDEPASERERNAPRAVGSLAVPGGHLVVVLGHRPPELGGYGDNAIAAGVRRKVAEILTGLRVVHPDLVVLTGLGLGAEQLGAEAAAAAGVPYVAVLPFPNPDAVWPAASRAIFQRLADGARDTLVLATTKPTSKQTAGMALGRRDDWFRSHAHGALIVWDGRDRAIGSMVKALERRIPDDVWVVSPET
ncbi:MAG: Ribonuclease [Actinomycetia bacterium]|nr:Ribonuclease [Actinomycetes bacterium]